MCNFESGGKFTVTFGEFSVVRSLSASHAPKPSLQARACRLSYMQTLLSRKLRFTTWFRFYLWLHLRSEMDVLPMCSIFQELQIVHDTGYFSALPSLEEYWQQVKSPVIPPSKRTAWQIVAWRFVWFVRGMCVISGKLAFKMTAACRCANVKVVGGTLRLI